MIDTSRHEPLEVGRPHEAGTFKNHKYLKHQYMITMKSLEEAD